MLKMNAKINYNNIRGNHVILTRFGNTIIIL